MSKKPTHSGWKNRRYFSHVTRSSDQSRTVQGCCRGFMWNYQVSIFFPAFYFVTLYCFSSYAWILNIQSSIHLLGRKKEYRTKEDGGNSWIRKVKHFSGIHHLLLGLLHKCKTVKKGVILLSSMLFQTKQFFW